MGVTRTTQQYKVAQKGDEEELLLTMIRLAKKNGRYAYRMIKQLLRVAGWQANHKKEEPDGRICG